MKRTTFTILTSIVFLALACIVATPAAAVGPYCDNACNCNTSCDYGCYGYPAPLIELDGAVFNLNPTPTSFTDSVIRITCGEYGLCVGTPGCPGTCGNLGCTTSINGTSGGDTLTGTSARECIYGNAGADTIYGNDGDDRLHGGSGNDTIYGGAGNDCLWGDTGNDYLNGDAGYDFIDGGDPASYNACYGEDTINCP